MSLPAGVYELYCGNLSCPSRREAKVQGMGLHRVHEDDIPDGELWLCPQCREES